MFIRVDRLMAWNTTFAVLVKVTDKPTIEAMLVRLEMGVPSALRGACTNGATVDREHVQELVRVSHQEPEMCLLPPCGPLQGHVRVQCVKCGGQPGVPVMLCVS